MLDYHLASSLFSLMLFFLCLSSTQTSLISWLLFNSQRLLLSPFHKITHFLRCLLVRVITFFTQILFLKLSNITIQWFDCIQLWHRLVVTFLKLYLRPKLFIFIHLWVPDTHVHSPLLKIISLPLLPKFLRLLQILSLLLYKPIPQQCLRLFLIFLILLRPQCTHTMKIPKFLQQSLMNNLLLCGMEFIELFNEVLFISLVEFFFWNLYFFQRWQSFVHPIRFTKRIGVSLLELLSNNILTVLSSYSNFLATPSCLFIIFMAILES